MSLYDVTGMLGLMMVNHLYDVIVSCGCMCVCFFFLWVEGLL